MFSKFKIVYNKIRNYFEWEFMTGHISIGNVTIYGRNAMRWACNIYTKKYGYICFRLPLRCDGKWWPLYLYFSPDGTPQSSTFMLGKKYDKSNWIRARIRYACFGHNFEVHGWNSEYQCENYHILRGINNMVDWYEGPYYRYARDHEYIEEDK